MRTLQDDLSMPLNKVERTWIRKPVTLILYVLLVWWIVVLVNVVSAIGEALATGYKDFFVLCWNGEPGNEEN